VRTTVAELASDAQKVVRHVVQDGQTVTLTEQGRAVARIVPVVGVSGRELAVKLKSAGFSKEDAAELKKAMDAAAEVFGYAGGD
jgi:antitoxin (DNA-binding transcriptional repressor) of toxin-antitoxin stability system